MYSLRRKNYQNRVKENNNLLFKNMLICRYGKSNGLWSFRLDLNSISIKNSKNAYVDNKEDLINYLEDCVDKINNDIKIIKSWNKRI